MCPQIDCDRATGAQAVKVPKVHWDWTADAQVEALLWLTSQDPLPETLSKVTGTYADLLVTLGKKHGAAKSLTDKAVSLQLRRLFIAHGKEATYAPNRHEVLRVLAAVIGKVLAEVDEAAVAVSATPAVGSSSAALAPSGSTGNLFRGKIRTTAAEVKSVATGMVERILQGAVGQISRLKVTVEAVRVPPAAAVGAADPGPASTTATADFDFGDAALSDAAFEVLALIMEYLHDTMATREAEQYKLPSPIPVTEKDLLDYCQTRLEKSKFASLLLMLARGKDPAQVQSGSKRTAERFNMAGALADGWLLAVQAYV